ncbi:MAG: biotin carboxylase N-terminal domain-containing protein, partial [Xanthomonadales bacterium]|nr:biotin carboxylase N-terminal domain-containing protein [Xanthomonadales bacterium]
SESYLDGEKILATARDTGAEAIHPGYGFLSENANFARAVEDAGLVFIGPSAKTIDKMGSKSAARQLMANAGVPVVPGYDGDEQDDDHLATEAGRIGYPLMIKAAAGGGGKGMRVVRAADDFAEALAATRREAKGAFGDQRMILERYLARPRHVEVQVLADAHGNTLHLYERDCSTQRRYQKVLEEAPAPRLPGELRERMLAAAVEAARAVDYRNAGTVEFIVETDDAGTPADFYFMEMNTRLQVEHPVTEMITGLDLVELQLRVAAGEPLPFGQEDVTVRGHAFEARLYAENPARGFLPGSGRLERLAFPGGLDGVRVDTGVREGDTITVHYDPMIAKLIVHAADRDAALARLREALRDTAAIGPASNVGFLQRLAAHPKTRTADIHTAYLDRHLDEVLADDASAADLLPALAGLLLDQEHAARRSAAGDPHSPWATLDGWRGTTAAPRVIELEHEGGETRFEVRGANGDYRVRTSDETRGDQAWRMRARLRPEGQLELETGGQLREYRLHRAGRRIQAAHLHGRVSAEWLPRWRGSGAAAGGEHDLRAPMPGKVIALKCKVGDEVTEGQALVVMEAMKMELTLRAPHDGTVAELPHAEGEFVEGDTLLVHFEEAE